MLPTEHNKHSTAITAIVSPMRLTNAATVPTKPFLAFLLGDLLVDSDLDIFKKVDKFIVDE